MRTEYRFYITFTNEVQFDTFYNAALAVLSSKVNTKIYDYCNEKVRYGRSSKIDYCGN